jgi:DNA-binding MarR family transcriptional regulator
MNRTPRRPRGETREMIRRLYLKGATVSEIAARVGTTQQNVSTHVRRLVEDGELKWRKKR